VCIVVVVVVVVVVVAIIVVVLCASLKADCYEIILTVLLDELLVCMCY
jgi:hypothetical protein